MKNKWLLSLCAMTFMVCAQAQTWIWYPGDYEIWLGNQMNNRRTERGAFYPPVWRTYTHYDVVDFRHRFELEKPEEISISTEGRYAVKLDNVLLPDMPKTLKLSPGIHTLNIKVYNPLTPPALYVKGETVKTDSTWTVSCLDKVSVKEINQHKKTWGIIYVNAGSWNFNDASQLPSRFTLARKPQEPLSKKTVGEGMLYDFGKETFGFVVFKELAGTGNMGIYYGETLEEALDTLHCETYDRIHVRNHKVTDAITGENTEMVGADYTMKHSKAFRYVYVVPDGEVQYKDLEMEYEYSPLNYRGSFRCNDEELNRIWDVAAYTLHLTTREFFIDGIKRDRWAWSGDAIQSYLMNYYLFFDKETVKRTIWLLRGKEPVTCHINTILDYTFFWFLSIYDYYMYTGDSDFVTQIYPRMQSLMDYVLERRNANGMVEGLHGDWVFIDWSDGELDKKGEVSFEQVLFCRSLETMAQCARIVGNETDLDKFTTLSSDLKSKLLPAFWNEEKKALVNNRFHGVPSESITRYANMFAIFYNYLNEQQKREVKTSVFLNDSVTKIITPYMRFYEMEALCTIGEQENVLKDIKAYWGGMLREGATSFWEKYNPQEQGAQHYAMYNRPYGKSLCHAWGASPIYLLGKYYLGVQPVKEGYKEFSITPVLGGLRWMEGSVPTPQGDIYVYMDKKTIKVKATEGKGYVYVTSKKQPKTSVGTVEKLSDGNYRIYIDTQEEVVIKY